MTEELFDLDKTPAFVDLTELADRPFDLTLPGGLTPERLNSYVCRGAGFTLHYGLQRVDNEVLDRLQVLADQSGAVRQFMAMKKGALLNRIEGFASEKRQVLHTAMRDVFSSQPLAAEATELERHELERLKVFLDELDQGRLVNEQGEPFLNLINIGIGGSDLGPRAIYLALAAYRQPGRRVDFIANVDPDDAATVLRNYELSRTLVNVVSKSGTTLETLTNEELVRASYVQAGLDPKLHFINVTGKGSPMDNPARYLRSFYMFDAIGGRYSTTSMVGGVLLGFALGYEGFVEILRGANDMDRLAEASNIRANPPLMQALLGIWNRNFLGLETLAILPYSQALIRFAAHLQQCDMESNGKSVNRQGRTLGYKSGPIVWGEPGTNGQHAFYQLIHQGTTVVPAEFIGFKESQYQEDLMVQGTTSQEKLTANMLAQAVAMATGQESDNPNRRFPGNRPSSILLADRLTPHTMGALLAFYEAKVVFQGFVWNINSFDQEGVQLGKVLATRLLGHCTRSRQEQGYDGREEDPLGWQLLNATGLLGGESPSK